MPFDYGKKKENGQWEHHPINVEGEEVRPYRDTYVHNKCRVSTKISSSIARTYQRHPEFYTHTFCSYCRDYFPISEFKWEDGKTVGE